MKKSTKIITTAVALALVVAAMVVGIYAATAGSASINANVSWTAQAGITFTFSAETRGGKTDNSVSKTVTASTSNTGEGSAAFGEINLNNSFKDTDDSDGVNAVSDIIYEYKLTNTGATAIKVTVDLPDGGQLPTSGTATEAGTSAAAHTPAVTIAVTGVESATWAALQTAGGVSVGSNEVLTITITLSLADDTTDIVTDAGLDVDNYNAGLVFAFGM